jgi:uncharacterized protein YukE
MGINISSAKAQANKARDCSSELSKIRNYFNQKKSELNSAWRADEIKYINNAIEKMNQKLNRVSSELDSIASDIISVAYEIKQEEEKEEKDKA